MFAAGWDELISILVGLVFLVAWLINQLSNAAKKRPAAQPAGRPPAPPPANPAGNAPAAPQADPLRSQIDEFLRRAGQQGQAGQPGQPAARPAEVRRAAAGPQRPAGGGEEIILLVDDEAAKPQRKTLSEQRRAASDAATARRAVGGPTQETRQRKRSAARRDAAARPQSVAEHVARRVGGATGRMRAEVADLGGRVIEADKQFDVQLHQKFDHELGSLGEGQADRAYEQPAASDQPSPAAQIVSLLTSPGGVRQAIVLNEILRRPEERW